MRGKGFAAGLLAIAGILGWSGASRGGDTIRLNMVDEAPAQNLVDDGQGADTIRTWYRGGWGGYRGFGWGGYRGLGWGGYRGFGWGGWGGRGWGWGGYGLGLGYGGWGWGGRGFGWGGYGGWGGRGFGWGGYGLGLGYGGLGYGLGYGGLGYGLGGYGGFYPGFGIGYGGLWGPCSGASASVYTLNMPTATLGTPLPGAPTPAPQQAAPNGDTFPYDGGPSNPVPKANDAPPAKDAPRSVPLEGRSVSLPKAPSKWSFPAYGETARRTTPASDRTYLTRREAK